MKLNTVSHSHLNISSHQKKIILFILIAFPFSVQASNGPTVNQVSRSLSSIWVALLKATNCDLGSPQNSLCIRKHHGETIATQVFGQPVNALILSETFSAADISGSVVIQQNGFLIGPIDGVGYKVIREMMSYGQQDKRTVVDNGLKVYAHPVNGVNINRNGLKLNQGQHWLDKRNEPWIYHWDALARVNEALKRLRLHLEASDS